MPHPSFFDEFGQLVMRILQSVASSDHVLFRGPPDSQSLDRDGFGLSDTMRTLKAGTYYRQNGPKNHPCNGTHLDCLTFNVRLPDRLAEYDAGRRYEIPECYAIRPVQ
jgi:hypothetical protein